jgi:hypothetical protein
MRKRAILVFLLVASLAELFSDVRTGGIDFIILMDTSLSMESSIEAAKRYAAGEIFGRLVEQGDWVALVQFFGKSEAIWKGELTSNADIATVVRSLNLLQANGRYTDIGSALDFVDALVLERGHPERPKYILLLTDERQEAPKDTKYYSQDYSIRHPLLEYVKRVDLGSFRLITVGYGLAAKVEGNARSLVTTLASPPEVHEIPLAGSDKNNQGTKSGNPTDPSRQANNSAQVPGSMGDSRGFPVTLLVIAISTLLLALAVFIVLVVKRRHKDERQVKKNQVELNR